MRYLRNCLFVSVVFLLTLTIIFAFFAKSVHATSQIVNLVGSSGLYTSLALRNNGLPVIISRGSTDTTIVAVKCEDSLCSQKNIAYFNRHSEYAALAVSTDDYLMIASPFVQTSQPLYFYRCTLALSCYGQFVEFDAYGSHPSITLNSSGYPVFSYPGYLGFKVATCANVYCMNGTTIINLDNTWNFNGRYNSLSLRNDIPVISYYEVINKDLKLVVCSNSDCSVNNIFNIDSVGDTGQFNSLALDSSGNPVIAYYDATNADLKLVICADMTCTVKAISLIDSEGDVGQDASLVLNSAGNPVISYYDSTNGDLKIAVCGNPACSTKMITNVDSAGDVGRFTSAKLGADGRLFVSYYDVTNAILKLYTDDAIALLPTPTTTPLPPRPDTIGLYSEGTFYLRNTNNSGFADIIATFGGDASDLPVVGDWNGDGVDTIGVYRNSTGFFFLSDSNTSPAVNYTVLFGNPGDTPFAGRWAADMTGSGIGVYRNSNGILYQRKSLTSGFDDFFAVYGNPGDQGFAGDWDGNGFDSIGIYRSSNQTWFLTNNSTPSGITFSDINFVWDITANLPVVGDWNGDGTTTVGLWFSGGFTLHSTNASTGSDTTLTFGPAIGKPISGKWVAGSRPPLSNLFGNPSQPFRNNSEPGSGD